MTLWSIHPTNLTARVSLMAFIALVGMVGFFAWHQHSAPITAAIIDTNTIDPTLLPVADETFVTPRAITWQGQITRIFVSGSGLEIASLTVPGGVFQAYMPGQEISPITSGSVTVTGFWYGYTCAYGGHAGGCVPDVQIQTISVH